MKSKIPYPLFNVGFELEFFLTKKNVVVYNASKEMEKRLGFSIDQNKVGSGSILLPYDIIIRTDGTPLEVHWYNNRYDNYGQLPDYTRFWGVINKIKLMDGFDRCFAPYLKEGKEEIVYGKKTKFHQPGNVYGSGKTIYNAYTHTSKDGKKQDGPGLVTERTAGLHLHFSVAKYHGTTKEISDAIFGKREITDELVKKLDAIYEKLFKSYGIYFSPASQARVDKFQTLGDYRIKWYDTLSGNPTFEYRQLDSSMFHGFKNIQQLIDIFQYDAHKYLEEILK